MSQEAKKLIKVKSKKVVTPLTESEFKTLFSNHFQKQKLKRGNSEVESIQTKKNCTLQNSVQQGSLFQKNYNKSLKKTALQPCQITPGTSLLRKTFSFTGTSSSEPASSVNPQDVPFKNILNVGEINTRCQSQSTEVDARTSLPRETFNFASPASTVYKSTFLDNFLVNSDNEADDLQDQELENENDISTHEDELLLQNDKENVSVEIENDFEEGLETLNSSTARGQLFQEEQNLTSFALQNTSSKEKVDDASLANLLEQEKELHDDDKCCNACRSILLTVLTKIDEVIEMNRQRASSKTSKRCMSMQFNLLNMLPIEDQQTLKNFDEELKTKTDLKKQLEQKIDSIGGENMNKMVANALSSILTDTLANQLTWKIDKTNKLKVEDFTFPKVVKDRVMNHFNNTETEILKRIQLWIQKSSDRLRNAQLIKKKQQSTKL